MPNHNMSSSGKVGTLTGVLVVFVSFIVASPAHSRVKPKLAVLDFAFIDTSAVGEVRGVDPSERRRIHMLTELVKRRLAASRQYQVLDNSPAKKLIDQIESREYFHECHGCELDVGKALHADYVLVGWVQKVSNLILNVNMVMEAVDSGKVVREGFVDIRSNSDESWTHGALYIVKHKMLPAPSPAPTGASLGQ